MMDPRDVHAQNTGWFLQLAGFFVGGFLGLLFGSYVIMGMLMPGEGNGLLLAIVAGFVGAYLGHRLALGALMR